MSQVNLSLVGEKEISDILAGFIAIVADIKAGKSAAQIGVDSVPALMSVVTNGSAALADVKADRMGSVNSGLVFVSQLLDSLGV